jgi:hypothetical protein
MIIQILCEYLIFIRLQNNGTARNNVASVLVIHLRNYVNFSAI